MEDTPQNKLIILWLVISSIVPIFIWGWPHWEKFPAVGAMFFGVMFLGGWFIAILFESRREAKTNNLLLQNIDCG